jgi:hypothetical protein
LHVSSDQPGHPSDHPSSDHPSSDHGGEQDLHLSGADARALDALAARGFAAPALQTPVPPRTHHVAGLLSLLSTPVAGEGRETDRASALLDVTMARVRAAASASQVPELQQGSLTEVHDIEVEATLSGDDVEALDAYVHARHQTGKVPSSLRARAERLEAMSQLITNTPGYTGDRAALLSKVVAELDASEAAQRNADRPRTLRLDASVDRPRRSGFSPMGLRLADVASIAAVLVLGGSVLMPVMSSWNTHRMRSGCVSHMGEMARGMGQYAGDYQGSLPVASASLPGGTWWDVGTPARSNSANLFTLRRAEYNTLEQLSCAGNAQAVTQLPVDADDWQSLPQVSYSYYVMFAQRRPDLSGVGTPASTVILADQSPVIRRALRGEAIYVNENSPNHGGGGQWALKADASAQWLTTPTIRTARGGLDNIWLPADLEEAILDAEAQQRNGAHSGTVELMTREEAARRRAARMGERGLKGVEAPTSPEDSFLGP